MFGTKDNQLEQLYFIAIVPPAEIQDEINAFKHEIAEKYKSSHALKSPPHITLHMPFKWKDKRFEELKELIETLNKTMTPFEVALQDFDFFEPRVVFVKVVENEALNQLQKLVVESCRKKLHLDNGNYRNRPFHPHVTIGFRDLKKAMFFEAQKAFENRKYQSKFIAIRMALLKHDGREWQIQL